MSDSNERRPNSEESQNENQSAPEFRSQHTGKNDHLGVPASEIPLEVTQCLKELEQIGAQLKKRMERYEEIYPRVEYLRKFRKLTTGQAKNLRALEDEIESTLFWQQALSKQFEKRSELAVKYFGVPFEQLLRISLHGGFEIEKDNSRASEAGPPPKEHQQPPLIDSGLAEEKSVESAGAPKGSQPTSSDGNQQNATQISPESQSGNPTASHIPESETHRNKRGRPRNDDELKMLVELKAKGMNLPQIRTEMNSKFNQDKKAEVYRSALRRDQKRKEN